MSPMAYQRPLLIVAERKANISETEKGTKGGYFCRRCKSEIVLTASSQQRIASRPDGNLICVQCVGRDPALAWKIWKQEIAG